MRGFITRPPVLTWFLGGSLVLVDEAAEDRMTLDPPLGQVGDGVVGPGAGGAGGCDGAPPVVMGLVSSHDRPPMPFAKNEHPVGDLGLDGEHDPFWKTRGSSDG